jgi:hypothetical protein
LKKTLIFPVLFFFLQTFAQSDWKQSLRYEMHVKFNPAEKSLEAQMKLRYVNHSPDTLSLIWFHVWPNAYRNDRTFYSEQLLENGDTRFYFSSKDQKGYLNSLNFRVNGSLAKFLDHPEYIDVIKLLLPRPLQPGDSIQIDASFHLRIPYSFNGNGYRAHHFEMRNWYPEPAVYDAGGWHPMPFLVQGGAFHESADFDVEIEAPKAYRIVAGAVADTLNISGTNNSYRFSLQNANAFAWIADTRYKLKTDHFNVPNGMPLTLQYFYISNPDLCEKILNETKKKITQLSESLTPYPHRAISVFPGGSIQDQNFSGLVSLDSNRLSSQWETSLTRNLTAQWFQTIVMTNQREQPWLSKGFIDYFVRRIFKEGNQSLYSDQVRFGNSRLWLRVAENENTIQPITTAAPEFSTQNDSLIAGYKTGLWLKLLEDSLGRKNFDEYLKYYFSRWKFGHPYPEDFKIIMTDTNKNSQSVFTKLNNTESIFADTSHRVMKPAFVFSAKNSERYNYIGLSPVPGYNRYDGFMLGALIHNINLPENKFEFLFTPLYAFGSKTLEGLGRMSYSWHPQNHFSKITFGVNGARFDTNKATDSTGNFLFANFGKLVPYIRVDFKPGSPRSTIRQWMDFKTYLIQEHNYAVSSFVVSSKDSLNHPNAITRTFYYVNQLSYNLQDSRALYPYNLRAEFQQSELFYRINLKADYFLNYPDGGGLQVRFFAAKFGVWNSSNLTRVTRFEPKLLGVTGEEDYLYEDYFVGRSASYAVDQPSVPNAGFAAQQIMNRDGGLKLRIDEIDFVQGQSENWVTSLNFNTTLPAKLFPFPVPIRIFFDVGTYSEAWQTNPPTSHFLYTGGIQLSLFKNVLNIYAPLIYSSDFKDVMGTTNFGRKITFSIDIQNINYKKIIRKLADHE